MKSKVIWLYRRNRKQWLEEWKRGEQSNEFFYGLTTLADRYDVDFIEGNDGKIPLQYFLYPFEAYISRRLKIGFGLHIPLTYLKKIRHADVLISTVDTCGLPLAMLKKWGWISGKIIYISQGLSDYIEAYGRNKLISRYYKKLLLNVEALVVLSEGARKSLADWLGIPYKKIYLLPFGVDCKFWYNTDGIGNEILAVGSDPSRDYKTLLQAVDGLPLHIISKQPIDTKGLINIRQTQNHTPKELRDLYSKARFVVVPLKDVSQPSGQSTTLQAMACGKAVILTKTRGFFGEDYLKSGENCLLLPPNDINALHLIIRKLWDSPSICAQIGQKAKETVYKYFNEQRMSDYLSQIINHCLSKKSIP